MNIVRINESIFSQFNDDLQCGQCWSYTYARKDHANLKDGKDKCCIHVYMEDFITETIRDSVGFINYTQHTFTLKILLDSLFDIQMFNELEPCDAESKFSKYIEPILECFPTAYNAGICSQDLCITKERIIARYNLKDQNKDGLVIQYTVRDNA